MGENCQEKIIARSAAASYNGDKHGRDVLSHCALQKRESIKRKPLIP